jgi:hypothetical protein
MNYELGSESDQEVIFLTYQRDCRFESRLGHQQTWLFLDFRDISNLGCFLTFLTPCSKIPG